MNSGITANEEYSKEEDINPGKETSRKQVSSQEQRRRLRPRRRTRTKFKSETSKAYITTKEKNSGDSPRAQNPIPHDQPAHKMGMTTIGMNSGITAKKEYSKEEDITNNKETSRRPGSSQEQRRTPRPSRRKTANIMTKRRTRTKNPHDATSSSRGTAEAPTYEPGRSQTRKRWRQTGKGPSVHHFSSSRSQGA
jgi:hypothetical protein